MKMITLNSKKCERCEGFLYFDHSLEIISWKKELRTFMDSIFMIDQNLVTDAVRTLALNTISAYQNGVSIEWHEAELGVYLVFIFGEINKSMYFSQSELLIPDMHTTAGGKGRAAFCQAPNVDRDKRKDTDYSGCALTAHGDMIYALVHSGISSYPHRAVALQFFETVARYTDFFKIRKECIIPTLESMVDKRSVCSWSCLRQISTSI